MEMELGIIVSIAVVVVTVVVGVIGYLLKRISDNRDEIMKNRKILRKKSEDNSEEIDTIKYKLLKNINSLSNDITKLKSDVRWIKDSLDGGCDNEEDN